MKHFSTRSSVLLLALLTMGALISGCPGADVEDEEYALVEKYCKYPAKDIGRVLVTDEARAQTYLTKECRDLLEDIIPFDETFESAPIGLKERIMEGFQAMVAYPLEFPDKGALFGVTSPKMGMIPADFYRIFEEDDDYNKSIFNYVLNKTETLTYLPKGATVGRLAEYSIPEKKMTIFDLFWQENMAQFLNPINSASTLIHEARHGDGYTHFLCSSSETNGMICDEEIGGPYGLQAVYFVMALHGSYTDPDYALPPQVVMLNGLSTCAILTKRIFSLPTALSNFFATAPACEDMNASNILEWEGLEK